MKNSREFKRMLCIAGLLMWAMAASHSTTLRADDLKTPYRIQVVDEDSGWPVPLVELKTTNELRFISDNAGVIAIDAPSLMGHEVWFTVVGHGYGVPPDAFGYRGIRLTPLPGESVQVPVTRFSLAKRIGRLTGSGLFEESQKLGEEADWIDAPLAGCDSVQTAMHRGKLFWAWGDTKFANYPLGVFDMISATTDSKPLDSQQPPLHPRFNYFTSSKGKPRAVADMPGNGPTWLTGYASLKDAAGTEHLVATYRKIEGRLDTYEIGLCVWNEATLEFDHLRTVWKKSSGEPPPFWTREGHAALETDHQGVEWLYVGNPLPHTRVRATFEAWQQPSEWEELTPPTSLGVVDSPREVQPHSGSIAWNAYRQRWVTVFMQKFGTPSPFGTLWYAEAVSPTGPWGPAVEILSHENYTFYNPRLHPEFTEPDSSVLFFEGTYTAQFSDHAHPTPLHDYNQILYRLDLDEMALPAASPAALPSN
ncbi:hypothetical protein [Aureliella helgolandensis]|uniref:DUF4185 domain-containing protein n=1 Tax=Aureliella helgolandensis TaxID=2527968 RepID=A0A518G1K9_9BACT|nr:hypothetical protein [Aureliella helgolandensis]QDV22420.1 hypothetical protein Q31a_07050 [Aureliella helgolandensis]